MAFSIQFPVIYGTITVELQFTALVEFCKYSLLNIINCYFNNKCKYLKQKNKCFSFFFSKKSKENQYNLFEKCFCHLMMSFDDIIR